MIALVLALAVVTADRNGSPFVPSSVGAATSTSSAPKLSERDKERKRVLDGMIAEVKDLRIDLGECQDDRTDLNATIADMAKTPPPPALEPAAPWWVPWAIGGAAIAGAGVTLGLAFALH